MCRPCGTSRLVVCRIVLPGFRPWRDVGDLRGTRCVRISAAVEPPHCGGSTYVSTLHSSFFILNCLIPSPLPAAGMLDETLLLEFIKAATDGAQRELCLSDDIPRIAVGIFLYAGKYRLDFVIGRCYGFPFGFS